MTWAGLYEGLKLEHEIVIATSSRPMSFLSVAPTIREIEGSSYWLNR